VWRQYPFPNCHLIKLNIKNGHAPYIFASVGIRASALDNVLEDEGEILGIQPRV